MTVTTEREPLIDEAIHMRMPVGTDRMTAEQVDAALASMAGWDRLEFYTTGPTVRDWALKGRHIRAVIVGTAAEVGRFKHAIKVHSSSRVTPVPLKETP